MENNKSKVNIQDSKLNNSPIIVESPGTTISYKNPKYPLTEQFKGILNEYLQNKKGCKISIGSSLYHQEAIEFADKIEMYLKPLGWDVTRQNIITSPTPKGIKFSRLNDGTVVITVGSSEVN